MFRAWKKWLHGKNRPIGTQPRLRVELLEDRTLPAFVTAPVFPVGPNAGVGVKPVAVVTGDFNNNGILDVVTANQGSNSISLLLGVGNGMFKPAVNFTLSKEPDALIAVDLNGDGRLDLVTANKSDNSISVLINNALGGFKPALNYAAGTGPVALAYGDFNHDSHRDLAVADNGANTVTLLLGDGLGHFTAGGTVTVVNSPTSVAVGDFNGDGFSDIATVSGGFAHLDVNLNNADGTFAPAVNYVTGFVANSVVIGDFNHDGFFDLAIACKFPSTDGVSVLLGNGDGTFQPFATYSVGGQTPITLAIGDFNGDGFQDLVTANGQFDNNSVSVLLGNGDGTFGICSVFTPGQNPHDVAVGDFNGDGMLDAVSANQAKNFGCIGVLLGNGDGALVASSDLVVSGPIAAAHADFNGDGKMDLAVITSSPSFSGIEILPGFGNGSFGAPILTGPINQLNALAVGDFNGDHIADLAVETNSGIDILLGNGDGTFGAPSTFAAGPNPNWLVVDDFNNDGISDIAVANSNSAASVSLLLGNGDGSFQSAISVAAGGAATYLSSADFNGDGKKDLVVLNNSVSKFSIALGHGDGSFGTATSYATAVDPSSVEVGDFNGDHIIDIAIPSFFGSSSGKTLTIYQNNGHGVFALKAGFATGTRPMGIAVTDLNGDHRLDMATVNNFADTVSVYTATSLGTFSGPVTYDVGDSPTWITAADFNGDGLPDLAVVNHDSGTMSLLETPVSAAAQFRVRIVPTTTTAGIAFQITVTAVNANNQLMPGYTGTVSFTSTDGKATLPAAYKFTAADHGVHRFIVTLRTAGSRDVIVHAGSAIGTGSITVVPAAANHLQLTTTAAVAGAPFDVTVTALDAFGNVATSFRSLVHFTTKDPAHGVSLPADYTFTAADNGVHTFSAGVTLLTAGTWAVTAIDPPTVGPSGSTSVAVQPAAASQVFISAPTTAIAGTPFSVTVTARDPYNNIATGFTGVVQFSSSDVNAGLPADYTFVASDKGIHTFLLQTALKTAGPQSITALSAGCTSGQQNGIVVKPGAAAQASIIGQPTNTFIATPVKPAIVVQVEDAYGNLVAAGKTITLTLATNPTAATLLTGAAALTNSSGLAVFTALSLSKAGQGYTLVAHAGTGVSAPSDPFTVYSTTHFSVVPSSTQAQAGTSFQVTVTALDAANHPDPTYVGAVHFTSTAGLLASLPADYTFQASDNGQSVFTGVMLNRAGLQTLTAADTLKTAVKGIASVIISAADLSQFLVTGFPLTAIVNTSYLFTVIAQDMYGNTVTGYLGTVGFTNAGGAALLPAPYTFTTLDKGRHVFTAKLLTVATGQSITVTDENFPTITGTESNITVKL